MTSSVLLALTLLLHPVPLDVIDRAAQVEVFEDRLEIVYRIGMNDQTLAEELARRTDRPIEELQATDREELWKEYRNMMLPEIAGHLKVTIDGKSVPVRPMAAEVVEQHHLNMLLYYEVAAKIGETPVRIEVVDENFVDLPGYHRLALKGRSTVEMLSLGGKPDLGRVPRLDVATMTKEERADARRVTASVHMIPEPEPGSADRTYVLLWGLGISAVLLGVGVVAWRRNRRDA